MRYYFKLQLIVLVTFSILYSNSLEERAFKAYKSKDYNLAINLYAKEAKRNNLKAYLMLALFYENGIGVVKDTDKAISFYKYILKKGSGLKRVVTQKDFNKLKIVIASLKRLYKLSGEEKYIKIAKKLEYIKNNIDISQTELFSDKLEDIKNFLILCPNAELISPEDREGIEDFDCALFDHFPEKMSKFMKLRRARFEVMKMPIKSGAKLFKKIEKDIANLREPLVLYLANKTVECYKIAIDLNNIRSCDYDYLLKSDPLLFSSGAYKMEQYVITHNLVNYILSDKEKKSLVDKLIKKISNKKYMTKWRDELE